MGSAHRKAAECLAYSHGNWRTPERPSSPRSLSLAPLPLAGAGRLARMLKEMRCCRSAKDSPTNLRRRPYCHWRSAAAIGMERPVAVMLSGRFLRSHPGIERPARIHRMGWAPKRLGQSAWPVPTSGGPRLPPRGPSSQCRATAEPSNPQCHLQTRRSAQAEPQPCFTFFRDFGGARGTQGAHREQRNNRSASARKQEQIANFVRRSHSEPRRTGTALDSRNLETSKRQKVYLFGLGDVRFRHRSQRRKPTLLRRWEGPFSDYHVRAMTSVSSGSQRMFTAFTFRPS